MKFTYPDGATPLDEVSGLKLGWVNSQQDLNRVEVENIALATGKYLVKSVGPPQVWFTVSMLRQIHRDMLSDVWAWAGEFRTTQTIPGVAPYRIRGDLESLCDDVRFWCVEGAELTVVEQSARIHHRLVLIHPFLNGNGRFARLVSDRYLKACNCPFPRWPAELNHDGQQRKRYIASLREADKGDYEPLLEYMVDHGAMEPSLRV